MSCFFNSYWFFRIFYKCFFKANHCVENFLKELYRQNIVLRCSGRTSLGYSVLVRQHRLLIKQKFFRRRIRRRRRRVRLLAPLRIWNYLSRDRSYCWVGSSLVKLNEHLYQRTYTLPKTRRFRRQKYIIRKSGMYAIRWRRKRKKHTFRILKEKLAFSTILKRTTVFVEERPVVTAESCKMFINTISISKNPAFLAVSLNKLFTDQAAKVKTVGAANLFAIIKHTGLSVEFTNTVAFKKFSQLFNAAFHAVRHYRKIHRLKRGKDFPKSFGRKYYKKFLKRKLRMLRYRAEHLYIKRNLHGYHKAAFNNRGNILKYLIACFAELVTLSSSSGTPATFVKQQRPTKVFDAGVLWKNQLYLYNIADISYRYVPIRFKFFYTGLLYSNSYFFYRCCTFLNHYNSLAPTWFYCFWVLGVPKQRISYKGRHKLN